MRRREFIAGLGGAAAWPLAVRAQQQSLPVIGFLRLGSPEGFLPAFRRGLTEAGYVDGQNVMIEVRWANNNGQLQGLAEDLVRRQPAVIVASGSVAAIRAANAAASTVPIAFLIGVDPMEYGLVASLNRPGGTITGISVLESELAGKQLNLLLEMAPQATKVAYLSGPARAPIYEDLRSKMVAAAQALEREIIVLEADSPSDIETVFVAIVEQQAGALIVGPFISLNTPLNRPKIIELAARYASQRCTQTESTPISGD